MKMTLRCFLSNKGGANNSSQPGEGANSLFETCDKCYEKSNETPSYNEPEE